MDGLPPIHETSPSPEGDSSKLEQLLMNLLAERDRLAKKLKDAHQNLRTTSDKLTECQTDNSALMRQLHALMPEVSHIELMVQVERLLQKLPF